MEGFDKDSSKLRILLVLGNSHHRNIDKEATVIYTATLRKWWKSVLVYY